MLSPFLFNKRSLQLLNLTFFNCQTVNVSVAMVTGAGASSYSKVLGLHVYGGEAV